MLRVDGLKKSYGGRVLFDEVNFVIGKNEKIGLIGRNGVGKSTLLKMMLGREEMDEGKVDCPKNYIVKSLEQNLEFSSDSAIEQCKMSLSRLEKGHTWKVETILDGLGFSDEQKKMDPNLLSSGYKVRLRLSEVLVSQADLLILDEPTNYLDIVSLRWLESFLRSWKGSFLLVTHDRSFMEKVVTHTMMIRRGKLKKQEGSPLKLISQIEKDEEIYEKTRQNMLKKKEKTEDFIRKFRAGARSAGLVQSRIKSLEKQDLGEKMRQIADVRFKFKTEEIDGNYIFDIEDLAFGYDKNKKLFKNLTLNVKFKDRIAIVGRNGAGKSTLLNVMARFEKPDEGEIFKSHGIKVGYFGSKSFETLNFDNTILKELHDMPGVVEQEVRQVCGALLFRGDDVYKKIKVLSGGEKSRVCLAKVMLKKCNMIFLDEPTNHLDMESCAELSKALSTFEGTVVVVTHDERMLEEVVSKLIVFDRQYPDGAVIFDGGYKDFLKAGGWENSELVEIVKEEEVVDEKLSKKELFELDKINKKKQRKLMMDIEKLEKKTNVVSDKLNKACLDKNVEDIEKLGLKLKDAKSEIEKLYEELDLIM